MAGLYRLLLKKAFFTLSKIAFISLYWKRPFSLYHFIENGLYQPFLKIALIKDFLLHCFIKKAFFCLYQPLSKTAFSLYHVIKKKPVMAFIKNGLYQGFFALSLYWKRPLSKIFCFIALLKIYTLTMISHSCNNNKNVF